MTFGDVTVTAGGDFVATVEIHPRVGVRPPDVSPAGPGTRRSPSASRPRNHTSGIRSAPGAPISPWRRRSRPARRQTPSSARRSRSSWRSNGPRSGRPQRAAAARALGRPPGPEGSLGKLASSAIARAAARVHSLIADASGMLAGPDSPLGGTIAEIFLSVPAISIAGGTDEIQRTILAERVLGLPKEPETDRDVPFRRVPKNA